MITTVYEFSSKKVVLKIKVAVVNGKISSGCEYADGYEYCTEHYYRVPNWTEKDTLDCLDIMVNCGMKAAMSEFDHPFVISQAKARGLNIIYLRDRVNIKNRRIEILITNGKAYTKAGLQ